MSRNVLGELYDYLREIIMQNICERQDRIGGTNSVVEIDESVFLKEISQGQIVTRPVVCRGY